MTDENYDYEGDRLYPMFLVFVLLIIMVTV